MESSENKAKEPFNGTAVTGAALGGASLLVQLLSGAVGGIGLGGVRPPVEPPATQRDLRYERELTEKDAEIGQLKAEKYADTVTLASERRLADKIEKIETSMNAAFAKQAEYNVANTDAVAGLDARTQQLARLTGVIINAPTMAASTAAASAFSGKAAASPAGAGS